MAARTQPQEDKQETWLLDQLTKSEFFHQKLHEYGLLEVACAIEQVEGDALDWLLDALGISQKAWNKVIHRGIKPVRVFAHPHVLTAIPRAVVYYRGLTMVSLKSMRNIRMPTERFETGKTQPDEPKARALAYRFNQLISRLIEADEHIDPREFDLWRGMAAGSQAQGSWQNRKGTIAEEVVKGLVYRRLQDAGLAAEANPDARLITLKDGRRAEFGSEPDIALYDRAGQVLAALEIKGGIDTAGILERVGAAVKSLRRAKQENPAATTILVMYSVSMSGQTRQDLEANRAAIDRWFTIESVLNDKEVREQGFELLGI